MKELLDAIENDSDYAEGVIKNCRWQYLPLQGNNSQLAGCVCFASNSNFDRWANSRIITLAPICVYPGDPPLEKIIQAIIDIFGEGQ